MPIVLLEMFNDMTIEIRCLVESNLICVLEGALDRLLHLLRVVVLLKIQTLLGLRKTTREESNNLVLLVVARIKVNGLGWRGL